MSILKKIGKAIQMTGTLLFVGGVISAFTPLGPIGLAIAGGGFLLGTVGFVVEGLGRCDPDRVPEHKPLVKVETNSYQTIDRSIDFLKNHNKPRIVETFDSHGNFMGTEIVGPQPVRVETFDSHGNFTGSKILRPQEERVETFDSHGNFTGTEKVRKPENRIETYDTHGNFTGTIAEDEYDPTVNWYTKAFGYNA